MICKPEATNFFEGGATGDPQEKRKTAREATTARTRGEPTVSFSLLKILNLLADFFEFCFCLDNSLSDSGVVGL